MVTQSSRRSALACVAIVAIVATTGCVTHYAYDFALAPPTAATAPGAGNIVEDDDLRAEIRIDAMTDAVMLHLRNKTDQIVQVEWPDITITHGAGTVTSLHPDVDLGWLQPGAEIDARLIALALPRTGEAAAAYNGRPLELDVPMIVRRAARTYRYAFTTHVRPL